MRSTTTRSTSFRARRLRTTSATAEVAQRRGLSGPVLGELIDLVDGVASSEPRDRGFCFGDLWYRIRDEEMAVGELHGHRRRRDRRRPPLRAAAALALPARGYFSQLALREPVAVHLLWHAAPGEGSRELVELRGVRGGLPRGKRES
jgi:hypothetical protein